jgi:DNA polymerase-1
MAKDPIMMKNYLEGKDIYTTVGDTMGVDRKAGKVLVLAMAYGVGPAKIASQIGCSTSDARDLLDRFGAEFSAVSSYRIKVLAKARKASTPYVETILGRKRFLPEMNSNDHMVRSGAERQAFNTRIQGSAADIIKLAMIRAHNRVPEDARILLTVHDELVTLTPDDKVDETVEAIRDAMEGINLLSVPLIADITVVDRWGEAK